MPRCGEACLSAYGLFFIVSCLFVHDVGSSLKLTDATFVQPYGDIFQGPLSFSRSKFPGAGALIAPIPVLESKAHKFILVLFGAFCSRTKINAA